MDTETPNSTNTPATPTTPPEETPKTGGLTQADVDRIVKERLARQERSLLEKLGVESLESAKSAIDAKKKADEAALTEQEKLQAQIAAAEKKALEAEERAKAVEQRYIAEQRKGTIETALQQAGTKDAKRLFVLLQAEKSGELNSLFGEGEKSGIADADKLKAFVKQTQTDYALFFGSMGAGSPSNAGGQSPNAIKTTEEAQAEINKKFGRM